MGSLILYMRVFCTRHGQQEAGWKKKNKVNDMEEVMESPGELEYQLSGILLSVIKWKRKRKMAVREQWNRDGFQELSRRVQLVAKFYIIYKSVLHEARNTRNSVIKKESPIWRWLWRTARLGNPFDGLVTFRHSGTVRFGPRLAQSIQVVENNTRYVTHCITIKKKRGGQGTWNRMDCNNTLQSALQSVKKFSEIIVYEKRNEEMARKNILKSRSVMKIKKISSAMWNWIQGEFAKGLA